MFTHLLVEIDEAGAGAALCWFDTIRCNSGWGIELSQASPVTPKLKTSVITFGSPGQLQLVYRCNISLTLTQIWENISHVYGSTGTIPHSEINSYVSPCLTVSTGARRRWQSLITIFTALFGPQGLLSTLFYVSDYVSLLSAIHSTNLHGGSTKHVV